MGLLGWTTWVASHGHRVGDVKATTYGLMVELCTLVQQSHELGWTCEQLWNIPTTWGAGASCMFAKVLVGDGLWSS